MTALVEPITGAERYARALETKNLTVKTLERCDVDQLIAAGWAGNGDPGKQLALALYRLQVVRDRSGLAAVVERAGLVLQDRLKGRGLITRTSRQALVVNTLRHWLNPTCDWCMGRCYVEMEGSPTLSLQECDACHGTGRTPLSRVIPSKQRGHAEWLQSEWDRAVSEVIGAMAAHLRPSLEL